MKAETKSPKNKATTTNDVKSGQNGNANKQTPLRIRDIFVTTSDDTHGRSTKGKTIWFHKGIPGTALNSTTQTTRQVELIALFSEFCHTLGQFSQLRAATETDFEILN